MENKPLHERCTETDIFGERFVGLRMDEQGAKVYFPLCYHQSKSEDRITRKEVLSLLSLLQKFGTKNSDENYSINDNSLKFPIRSYQFLILDYLNNGYYVEKETTFNSAPKGKINWKRTIQKKKAYISDNSAVYLDFIVKQNRTNENIILTRIHEFCVYQSFLKLGWLYTSILPMKPRIKYNQKAFLSVLKCVLSKTNNDSKKELFFAMINVIENTSEGNAFDRSFSYGTKNFEYVWERMIDFVFGEDNKEIYFPKARWSVVGKENPYIPQPLEPDTIIKLDNKIYILDAKYYKFGLTDKENHLPAADSIQKQITYGEFLASHKSKEQTRRSVPYEAIYNAFVMPFDKLVNDDDNYKFIGIATADWKSDDELYENVAGILLDTKHIMQTCYRQNFDEIEKISMLIEKEIASVR